MQRCRVFVLNAVLPQRIACLIVLGALCLTACSTYYQDNLKLQRYLEQGDLQTARQFLEESDDARSKKNRLLYLFNQGSVAALGGDYQRSNLFFEEAHTLTETYRTSLGQDVLSYLVNPKVLPYRAEDFEAVMVHYYMALNYLQLGSFENAIVECRRINIKLNELNDLYEYDNRYSRDAFALTLMGLIYDASGDDNNAFIAYRNAVEVYESDYQENYGLGPPRQLQYDLIRSAYRTGFHEEVRKYEQQFGLKYVPERKAGGKLIFFWNNGFGPVKSEFAVNFTKIDGAGGLVTFESDYQGVSFPFHVKRNSDDKNALEKLSVFRVAFPRYRERQRLYEHAELRVNDAIVPLELAQDINAIAFKALEDRMLREFGTALLRVAIKKAAEYGIREENETVGAIVGLVSAISEQADTRNWQILPHSISYARVALPAGTHSVSFTAVSGSGPVQNEEFTFSIREGGTIFHSFHSLASKPGRP